MINSNPFAVYLGEQYWEERYTFSSLYGCPVAPTFLRKGKKKNSVSLFVYLFLNISELVEVSPDKPK